MSAADEELLLPVLERAVAVGDRLVADAKAAQTAEADTAMRTRLSNLDAAIVGLKDAAVRRRAAIESEIGVPAVDVPEIPDVADPRAWLLGNDSVTMVRRIENAVTEVNDAIESASHAQMEALGVVTLDPSTSRLLERVATQIPEASAAFEALRTASADWKRLRTEVPNKAAMLKTAGQVEAAWDMLTAAGIDDDRRLMLRMLVAGNVPFNSIDAEDVEWLRETGLADGLRVTLAEG